jgi:hypothetical protein
METASSQDAISIPDCIRNFDVLREEIREDAAGQATPLAPRATSPDQWNFPASNKADRFHLVEAVSEMQARKQIGV